MSGRTTARSSETKASTRIPTWFLLFCIAVSVISIGLMLAGAWRTGSPWDETTHIDFLRSYFDTGYNTFSVRLVDGQPHDYFPWVFAPLYELVLHGVGSLVGVDTWGSPSMDASVFPVRHVVIACTSVLGALATAAIVRVLTGSWRWAVIGFTLIISIPMWLGLGMQDNKDVPVALGYTTVTLALILLAYSLRSPGRGRPAMALALLFAGTVLALGTRVGLWAPLLASYLLAIAWLTMQAWRTRRDAARRAAALWRIVLIPAVAALAYLTLLAVYPKAYGQVWNVLAHSVSESTSIAQGNESLPLILIPGIALYIPKWLLLQLPLLHLALIAAGLVLAGIAGWRVRGRIRWTSPLTLAVLLLLAQMALVATAAVLMRSQFFDAIRHFLFALPPLVVLITLALRRIAALSATWAGGRSWPSAALWAGVSVLLLLPLVGNVMLFPYSYAYVNEIAGARDLNGVVSTDYWRLSGRELMAQVPTEDYTSCQYRYTDDEQPSGNDWPCDVEGSFYPYYDQRGPALPDLAADEFVFIEANRGRPYPPPNCTMIGAVTRSLYGHEVVMSYVARCQRPAQ